MRRHEGQEVRIEGRDSAAALDAFRSKVEMCVESFVSSGAEGDGVAEGQGDRHDHGAILFKSGGWRHLDRQAFAALQDSQSQTHRLPVSISPVAPKAEEVAIVSEAFGGRVCLAGCLTGGELTPMADDTSLQTFSSLLLIFRDREKVC